MNKTLRSRRVPVAEGWFGEIRVATVFHDAERGPVRAHAAPLLAATLPARQQTAPAVADGPGVMFAVSYLDRGGQPGGFALIAHRDDAAGLAAAEEAMTRWRGALRSRRLLVADMAPLCEGGIRARRMREDAGDQLFVPAHGAPLGVRAEAAARGLRVIDATCPLVAAVQHNAMSYASRGDTVLVIGRATDAALGVLTTYAGETAIVVHDTTEAEALQLPDPRHVSFVIEPGMPADQAMRILAVLRHKFPELSGHHLDALCEVASDRAIAIENVIRSSELTLALTGDPHDPEIPGGATALTSLKDLDRLAKITAVGLFSTSSAPAGLEDQVIGSLAGLGPLSVRRRSTHTTAFAWASSRATAAFPA